MAPRSRRRAPQPPTACSRSSTGTFCIEGDVALPVRRHDRAVERLRAQALAGPLLVAADSTSASGSSPSNLGLVVDSSNVTHFVGARHGEGHRHHLPGEDVVVGVDQLDLDLVLAGRQPGYVDCVVVTRIGPPPREVVDGYVQMPDAWRCAEGACPEHRYDAHILHPVLGLEDALRQRAMKWRVHDQFGHSLMINGDGRWTDWVGFDR